MPRTEGEMTVKHILRAAGLVLAAAPAFAGNVDNEPHSWMLLTIQGAVSSWTAMPNRAACEAQQKADTTFGQALAKRGQLTGNERMSFCAVGVPDWEDVILQPKALQPRP